MFTAASLQIGLTQFGKRFRPSGCLHDNNQKNRTHQQSALFSVCVCLDEGRKTRNNNLIRRDQQLAAGVHLQHELKTCDHALLFT